MLASGAIFSIAEIILKWATIAGANVHLTPHENSPPHGR